MARASNPPETILSPLNRLLVRSLTVAAFWIVLASAVYFVWQFPVWVAWILSGIALISWIWWTRSLWRSLSRRCEMRDARCATVGDAWPLALVALIADGLIVGTAFLARTDEGLISPWQVLPIGVFGLFFVGTLFVLLAFPRLSGRARLLLAILHTATAYSISLIVYKLGFGFDPFVHEAATNYIVRHGAVDPKTPFYIGQYVLVAGAHHLTGISVAAIQALLVPLLASVLLPWVLTFRARPWIAWIFPFAYFTFTVPFNLGMLGLVFCLLLPGDEPDTRLARLALAIATLAIHPLVGIPTLALVLSKEISLRWERTPSGWLAFLLTFCGLVGALSVYALGHGGQWAWPDGNGWMATLLTLFRPPFVTVPIAPFWSVLYIFYALWPWMLVFAGTRACLRAPDDQKRTLNIPIGLGAGLLAASILTAGAIRYKDIVPYEQFEFALRLLALLPWIVLPGLLAVRPPSINLRRAILIALLATVAWHVNYPQLNPVMHVYSPGVSRTDFLTVAAIERLAQGQSYAALTPQLTSAAALRDLGFERSVQAPDGSIYPFAIPTGGYLYSRYLELFDGRPPADVIHDARSYVDTELLFVAIPFAWDDGTLDRALTRLASHREIVDGTMRLYLITP